MSWKELSDEALNCGVCRKRRAVVITRSRESAQEDFAVVCLICLHTLSETALRIGASLDNEEEGWHQALLAARAWAYSSHLASEEAQQSPPEPRRGIREFLHLLLHGPVN